MAFTPSENPITHPTRESYTELRPFRFWCQKVLPLVYDDSLSYYELLCKVVDYLNKTMEDVDHMNTDIDTLYSNFQEFQEGTFTIYNELVDYVNTYFDELDVQEEINNKLDSMVVSGELVNLLQPTIADEVSAWLAEHLTPTQPTIDDTLTISGAGADAKVTGNLIRNVTRDYYNSAMFKKSIVSKNAFGLHSIGENSSEHWFYVNNNNQTFGMSEIKYADNPIVVFKHQSAVDNGIECAVQMFTKTGEHFFGNISLGAWFGASVNSGLLSTSIPSGVYYWIGFRNNTNPCTLTVDDISNNFEIFEPVNKVGVASSSTTKPFSYSQNISIVDIDIKHAETDLLITSDDWSKCIYTIQYYTDHIPTAIASTEYSLQKDSVIPKGSYYRIIRWAKDNEGNNIQFDNYENMIYVIDSRIRVRNNSEEYLIKKGFDRSKLLRKDLLANLQFGNTVTSGNETNGYKLNNSPQTFGLANFVYADKPVVVFMHLSAVTANIQNYVMAYKYENNKFVKQRTIVWPSGNVVLSSCCIPSGWYYWIGFRDGNNPTHLAKEDLYEHFEIYEDPNNMGFGSSRTSQLGISSTGNLTVCNIDAEYSDTDLLVTAGEHWCKDLAITWEKLADLESGGTDLSYTNVADFIIPKGTYYRYFILLRTNGENADNSKVTPDTALKARQMIKIVPVNEYYKEWYDNNKIDTNGMFNYISMLANRVYQLEKLNNINTLPNYYNTDNYLENKITAINNARPENGVQFIFISDVHIDGYQSNGGNAMHSHSLINKICDETLVSAVFNGGDFLNNQNGYSVEGSIRKIKECVEYTTPDNNCKHFVIAGNHDGGIDYGSGGTIIAPRHLTNKQVIQASNVYGQAYNVVYDIKSPFQYYIDDNINKVRYIVLDYGLRDLVTDEAYFDTLSFYLDALMSTQANWHIVIFNHMPGYNEETNSFNSAYLQYIINPANAYKARGEYNDFSSYTRNFSNCKGVIACLIFGHKHADYQGTTEGGIPWFITTTDNAGANVDANTTRTIGTVNEQAFDVFTINKSTRTITVTRIGGGLDRTASY